MNFLRFFSIGFLAFSITTSAHAWAGPIERLGDDVVIHHSSMTRPMDFAPNAMQADADLATCRAQISKIICWVEPPVDDHFDGRQRPCLPGGEKFASFFEGHFDRSPDLIKKMYCHLDKIWVEKSFQGTAYAGMVEDAQKHVTAGVGIRQEVLDTPLTFDDWLSWKEETSFGGNPLTTGPRLGIIQYVSNHATKDFFLDYVLDHEFGHLFDFANHLNQTTTCDYKETSPGHWERTGDCKFLAGSWGALSWQDVDTPKPEMDFPLRKDVCFYFCEGKFIDAKNSVPLFSNLMNSSFQSTYASRYPTEDWAETFALYLAHFQLGLQYHVVVQGQSFDLSGHFQSQNLAAKRDYVSHFLSRTILYPGE